MSITCSEGTVFRLAKSIQQRCCDGTETQNSGHSQVNDFGLILTVEGVVEPWYQRSQDEERYADIVQLGEEFSDKFRVAVHSVIGAR